MSDKAPRSLQDLYEEECDRLVRMNDRIDDYQDDAWLHEKVEKLKEKRDIQEVRVGILKTALEQGTPVEEVVLPGFRRKSEADLVREGQLELFPDDVRIVPGA